MKIARSIDLSLRALFAHRLRAGLALSGVGIGVAAVVVTGAIGAGAEHEIIRSLEALGTNLLIVKPLEARRLAARKEIQGLVSTLSLDDFEALSALDHVALAAPATDGARRVKAGNRIVVTTIRGTTTEFVIVRRFVMSEGRFFDRADDGASKRVAVLGARVAQNLFPERAAIGQTIRIGNVPFEVIGVLEAKGVLADGDQDNQIVVPLRTALRRVFNAKSLSAIYVSADSARPMTDAEAEMRALLEARHRRPVGVTANDFAIQNPARSLEAQRQTADSLKWLTTSLAALALLVGGSGILALMLLSVSERTSEIGLRMAVGARPCDIVLQFLVEAACLSFGGWLTGLALGVGGGFSVALFTDWNVAIPRDILLASLGVTIGTGLGFGALPARRAARVPPIHALVAN